MNEKPRPTVLLAANSCWNLANFRGALIAGLQARGYDIRAAAPTDDSAGALRAMGVGFDDLPIRSDGLNPLEDARLFGRYLALLRRRRPTVLLGFTAKPNVYGCMAAGFLGIPAIANVSGLGTAFIRGGTLERLVCNLYRLAFRKTERVFFQNREDRALFVAKKIVRESQAGLLPGSGVNISHFVAGRPSGGDAGELRFLFVGRLIGDKGVREFVDAARLVRRRRDDCRFALLGPLGVANRTAISQAELDGWVAEGVVEYRGSTADVKPHLEWADAVVLPSYREGLSRVLLEAGAMSRPLLASNVPGNRDLVQDGVNGLLFTVRSAADMARALECFADLEPARRTAMAESSRRRVEQEFDEAIVIERYVQAIAGVIGDPASTTM